MLLGNWKYNSVGRAKAELVMKWSKSIVKKLTVEGVGGKNKLPIERENII